MSRILLSHAAQDGLAARALKAWLEEEPGLAGEIFLDVDRASGIRPGSRWKDEMRRASERCQAVLCLVSPAWEVSAECAAEYRLAEYLGKRIFPVRLSPDAEGRISAEWQRCDVFGDGPKTVVTVDGQSQEFLTEGLRRLRLALRGTGIGPDTFGWPPSTDPDRAPYRGWQPFEAIDAGVYFGRNTQISQAVDRLRSMRAAADNGLFVVMGPSGSGKSSFLRAGLLPRLARDDQHFFPLEVVRPQRSALVGESGLAHSIHRARAGVGLREPAVGEIKAACDRGDLAALAEFLTEAQMTAAQPLGISGDMALPTLILPLDQAEELFAGDISDASRFLQLVAGLLAETSGLSLIVVATIRSDRYEALQTAPELVDHSAVLFDQLKPMAAAMLREVIVGPAQRVTDGGRSLQVADDLLDALINDCSAGGDTLPLLALTLARLYEDYSADGDLTLDEYHQMGGMSGLIQNEIDTILATDADSRREQLELLRGAFVPYLVAVDPRSEQPARRTARWADLPIQSHELLNQFVARRLLIKDVRDGDVVVEIAVDSLLRQWDDLSQWLRAERDDLLETDRLLDTARDWEKNDRDVAWLLIGQRLRNAERLADKPGYQQRLESVRPYLQASRREAARMGALANSTAPARETDIDHGDVLLQKLEAMLESERFAPYRGQQALIIAAFRETLPELQSRAEPELALADHALWELKRRVGALRRFRPVVWLLRSTTAALTLTVIYAVATAIFRHLEVSRYLGWVGVAISVLAVFIVSMWAVETRWRSLRSALAYADLDYVNVRLRCDQQFDAWVEEECTRIINATLRRTGRRSFSTKAPRLVEVETSDIVPSRSPQQLRDFIAHHECSAVGVAGPRGSGKTTLLSHLNDDEILTPHWVFQTAPVHYDATDFLRRLYLDVARMVNKDEEERARAAQRAREDRVALSRAALALGAVFVGMVLAIPNVAGSGASLFSKFDALGRLGLAIAAVGVLAFVYMAINRLSRTERGSAAQRTSGAAQSVRLAAEAINNLKFASERSAKSKNAFSIFGKAFAMEDEDSLTLRTREQTPIDLAKGLRDLLRACARDSGKRILITIDELGKLSTTEHLIETINGLKDLFRIPGVHFVVSVSTDALRSFEQRGLVSRDAFDSSFDLIVGVKPFTPSESLSLLDKRIAGFPRDLGLFCHAWSGGLPRELIRIARRCLEVEDDRDTALGSATLMRTVIGEDLAAMVESELRRGDLHDDAVTYLRGLRQYARELAHSLSVTAPPDRCADFVCLAEDTVTLGDALVSYFACLGEDQAGDLADEPDSQALFEVAAYAMACRTDAHGIRSEAFEIALRMLRAIAVADVTEASATRQVIEQDHVDLGA